MTETRAARTRRFISVRTAGTRRRFFRASNTPPPRIGKEIAKLPADVATVYNEVRDCTASGSHLACVLACRVLLTHVAHEKAGFTKGSFEDAIDAIEQAGYISPKVKPWVDKIRTSGNAANHKLVIPKKEDAEAIVKLVETLLMLVYELP